MLPDCSSSPSQPFLCLPPLTRPFPSIHTFILNQGKHLQSSQGTTSPVIMLKSSRCPLMHKPVYVFGFHQGVQWILKGWCQGRWKLARENKKTRVCKAVRVGKRTGRGDGFPLEKGKPGGGTVQPGREQAPRACGPSAADTPLLLADYIELQGSV